MMNQILLLSEEPTPWPEAESKEKFGVWDPMSEPGVYYNLTLCPTKVVDPYSCFPDPDPDLEFEAGYQYGSGSGSNPDPGL